MNIRKRALLLLVLIFTLSGVAKAADYTLGAGDVIEISVYQQPDLRQVRTLASSGKISFPNIGEVGLAGKTQREAEKILAQKLKASRVIVSPDVSVRIIEYKSKFASVDGLVNTQGEYPVVGDLTIHQLISRSGGLRDGASSIVTLFRKGQGVRKIDLYEIYRADARQQDYRILPGDRVLVELANLEELEDVFYTYGAVENSGSYKLVGGMTVQQGLSVSGGLTERAARKKIKIIRANRETGRMETISASLTDKIQANDVIEIEESRF